MAFTLKIRFIGLNLFVRYAGRDVLDVLMPAAGVPGGAEGMPAHVARLVVDTAYLRPGSTLKDGLAALAPLEGRALRIEGRDPMDTSLPGEVADLDLVIPRRIDPQVLGDEPGPTLTARVALHSGRCTGTGLGGCWIYPPETPPRQLAQLVEWTIGTVDGDRLELALTTFGGGAPGALPILYPIEGAIEVEVFHTVRAQLPPQALEERTPERDEPAMHFRAYDILFDPPPSEDETPVPVFWGIECAGGGSRPYTCMGPAQALSEPPLS
jgi:hypothetical protein